jgi:hypothetical protein
MSATPGIVVPVGRLITPGGHPGPPGLAGSNGTDGAPGLPGTDGLNAFNVTSGPFVVPPVAGTVNVTLEDASWVVIGQTVWVEGAGGSPTEAGAMLITARTGNQVTLMTQAAIPGTSIPLGAQVSPGGPQGLDGAPGSTGPPGPNVVSADPGNVAILGSDGRVYVPQELPTGVVDGSDAPAGQVGEFRTSVGAAVATVSATWVSGAGNITLPAGDWQVNASFTVNGSAITSVAFGLSSVPSGVPGGNAAQNGYVGILFSPGVSTLTLPTGVTRWNITVATTIYCMSNVGFTGTANVAASFVALRIR